MLKENMEEHIESYRYSQGLSGQAQETLPRINKWDYINQEVSVQQGIHQQREQSAWKMEA